LFPPASSPDDSISPAENVSFKRARDCGLAHHQFYFFRGGRFQIIELSDDDEQQPAAKGAWNISLDISQAAYIVFFFFFQYIFFSFFTFLSSSVFLFFPLLCPIIHQHCLYAVVINDDSVELEIFLLFPFLRLL
jgi:hypothetical protein